jgi:hypothetical protein
MKSLNPKIVEDKREEEARRIRDNQTIRWTQIHPHHRTYQENSNLVTVIWELLLRVLANLLALF